MLFESIPSHDGLLDYYTKDGLGMLWECSDNGLFAYKAQGFLHGECVVNLVETAGIFDHIPMSAS